ncbi:hypothetical protein DY000_02035624 [Brassica cretica]|uniref:Serine aminopeptidase S33 domain-containing protein n=1 Tax=Brassica cretica TaxID=69181 RepID=A0ABQ7DLH7_BRACR|nr:hypothetical protein DY000_02035624 [Brassica cretica]
MYEENFVLNSRGMKLFTCVWKPVKQEPKALLFLCHGYAAETSITMNSTATRLAKAGFAVYGMDYEGHGKSEGLSGYISNFDDLVDDVSIHYSTICEKEENKGKVRFLLGESMGGAVVLLLARKKPDFWDGAVLVAPMCKLAEEVKPHPVVISILIKLCSFIPTWKIVPGSDILDIAIKEPHIRTQVRENEFCYKGRPRLNTAYQLLLVSLDLEKNLQERYLLNKMKHFIFTENLTRREENKGKMRFMLGESMGGAVVLLLSRKKPEFWDGALLVAPMCKIAEEMKPSPFVISILTKLISVIPKWKIIPTQDIIDISYKQPEIRKQVRENPLCYKGRPRLKTAYELLRISIDLEKRLQEVLLPFMALHGDDDKVTDKAVSQELYRVAVSSDKTLKLYSGMWHGLLNGETQENIEIVFADVIGWLEKRTELGNDRFESELKHNNDGFHLKE